MPGFVMDSQAATRKNTFASGHLLKVLTRPGRQLMLGLPMTAKMAALSVTLTLPLAFVAYGSLSAKLADMAYADTELEALATLERLTPVMLETERLREQHLRGLAGEAQSLARVADARHDLQAAMNVLDTHMAQHLSYGIAAHWEPVKQRLMALTRLPAQSTLADTQGRYDQAIGELVRLTLLNGEISGLILDPQAHTYQLAAALTNDITPLVLTAANLRTQGLALLSHAELTTTTARALVIGQASELTHLTEALNWKFSALGRAGGTPPPTWARTHSDLLRWAKSAQSSFSYEGFGTPAGAFVEEGASMLTRISTLQGDMSLQLKQALRERRRDILKTLIIESSAMGMGLLLLGYLLASFTMSFGRSIKALNDWVDAVSAGDLSTNRHIPGKDELARMGTLLEHMSHRLSVLVADIRSSAALVDHTGQLVASGSGKLAARTDEQAQSLRTSVVAIKELSSAVDYNATAAQHLDTITDRLTSKAEEANVSMTDTVQAMHAMQEAAERVAMVITVIDDVAFQTGMLSLNASVEAARAGEAGKGFAIVASEIRQLAQRCAGSAEEIRSLISATDDHATLSASKLDSATSALTDIFEGVRDVSAQLRAISTSTMQQSIGLKGVMQSVGNLDHITSQNAALVEESTTASSALVTRARMLRESVASMRLRQGSADEALSLVKRAVAHIEQAGRMQAESDFHNPARGFIDRDLYIFSLNRQGIFSVFGARSEIVGQHFSTLPGLDEKFLADVWAASDAGGGWVRYQINNPLTGTVSDKESYVEYSGDGYLVGCGVYRSH
jgi:methyl-accepting chemotaxis protein